jgi:very-short-patch-repair endonuclease
LRDLANQYLYDNDYRSTWHDPQRSLFDEAKMRFGGMLTLLEHRRCVPEIIGFSNQIAYEPDGVRLIPVRQFGADRLEPIRPVFVRDGFQKGSSSSTTNPVEADAVVAQIAKCLADPRYDGLTFGVISLLGSAQAKLIQSKLLEVVKEEEWSARDLRCGDAADFQGSERDVMFLSMVAAHQDGRRLAALTATTYVQRYNVSASRAKDQLWLFHSVDPASLTNAEDMRRQLLEYCYGISRRTATSDERVVQGALPEDQLVAPFDSLFEQRVCNRLLDRGFSVIPQYPALGYSLDLVVTGATTRLAVECDGDAWHGPDAYARDMGRQRELERCGWHFFRVLESEFYLDQIRALAPLWEKLDELSIRAADWTTPLEPGEVVESDDHSEPDLLDDIHTHEIPAGTGPVTEPDTKLDGAQDLVPNLLGTVEDSVPQSDNPWPDDMSLTTAEVGMPGAVNVTEIPASRSPLTDTDVPLLPHSHRVAGGELPTYDIYAASLPPAATTTQAEILAGLLEIVAVEGPMVGHRLHAAYVRSSAGHRVGPQIGRILDTAVSAAVRRGLLIQEDPLAESEIRSSTFRLPEQSALLMRELGPRTFDQVPPAELAQLMLIVASRTGRDDLDRLFRETMAKYDIRRLGSTIRARLQSVWTLANTEQMRVR